MFALLSLTDWDHGKNKKKFGINDFKRNEDYLTQMMKREEVINKLAILISLKAVSGILFIKLKLKHLDLIKR